MRLEVYVTVGTFDGDIDLAVVAMPDGARLGFRRGIDWPTVVWLLQTLTADTRVIVRVD
jgi:hypothetical protein